ncbi:MAG: hypothetical protein NT176_18390, partial [Proteobacteria bacterium]|nr:hypothetical protein [Pseudomonadota bacterium]
MVQMFGGSRVAMAQTSYQRPTTIIVPGTMGPKLKAALEELCKSGCEGTRFADRTFSDGIVAQAIATDTTDFGKNAKTTLLEKLKASGAARTFILRQFMADKDFTWRNDALSKRAEYGVTVAEAQKLIRAQTGIDPQILRLLTAGYIFVVSSPKEEMKDGGEKYDASAQLSVAVYRLGYKDEKEVMDGLGQFWCDAKCTDRAAKRAKFDAYQVPIEYLTTYTASAASSVEKKDGEEKAWAEVAGDALDELVDETASAVTAFAVQEKLIAVDPAAARIGKKEGVKPGARYYVMKANANADGTGAAETRGAMLLADKVADNRKLAFTRLDVKVTIAQVDSTTFKQAYPGEINRGDKIIERPSAISLSGGLVIIKGKAGAVFQVRTEENLPGVNLPIGLHLLGELKGFSGSDESKTQIISVGVGYEFMPLHGRLRIMPEIFYGKANRELNKFENKYEAVEYGVEMGLRFHPEIELLVGVRG